MEAVQGERTRAVRYDSLLAAVIREACEEQLRSSSTYGHLVGTAMSIQSTLYSTDMTVLTQEGLGTLARVGKALADPTRRRVLVQLIDGPGYPAEMADSFGTTRANLSNHLTCLRECGLVSATAEGRRVRYELADQRLAEGLRILAALDLPGTCQ
jgi:ArsR family transcriptional regulator, cadmium/lead-responsive transcriptional repressor